MKANGILFLIFSSLLILGGTMGYIKAHSTISLLTGSISGLSLALLGYKTLKGSVLYENLSLLLLLLLDVFFAYRLLKVKVFFPAGLMTFLSSVIIIIACISIRKRLSKTVN
ncbi:MAG: TMEM14 family protein [Simkaniaceae bacterium]|nr:TMEM14 family protein [Simkaniaceae bacterium]